MEQKTISRRIILKVAKSARTPGNHMHVIARGNKWVVKRNGAKRVSRIYDTKLKAVKAVRSQVNSGKISYALVHDLNGKVAQKII